MAQVCFITIMLFCCNFFCVTEQVTDSYFFNRKL